MDITTLQRHFDDCALPVRWLDERPTTRRLPWQWLRQPDNAETFCFVDVAQRMRPQEHFRVFVHDDADLYLRDKRPATKHLRLQLRYQLPHAKPQVRNYLLGHDERQLFVVAPNSAHTVEAALASLKPIAVIWAERRGLKVVRQGDWFFIRMPNNFDAPGMRYTNERIGMRHLALTGNPHIAQEQALDIVPVRRFNEPDSTMLRLFVRGTIRHAEHRTLKLQGWHQAVQNRAAQQLTLTIGYWD